MVDRSSGIAVVVDALKQFSPFACYSGKVPVTSISIGQPGTTLRLCTEPAGMMEPEAYFPAPLQSLETISKLLTFALRYRRANSFSVPARASIPQHER
jgi:hypothetical protein